ncbi:MAG TPA: transglutaminase family protein [Puia sp.]|nr:transglutaminase family protein [Puia sp.]
MPRFTIHHITKYTYDGPVRDSANQIVLFPIKDEYQEVLKQELTISGEPNVDIYKDYYGNEVGSFTRAEPHNFLLIDSKVEVITKARPDPVDQMGKEEQWTHLHQIRWQVPYMDFLKQEQFPSLQEIMNSARLEEARALTPLEAAQQLKTFVYDHFKYIKGVTSVETTIDEIWKLKAGVCQDFAHILLFLLRQIGIPARYVSGYVCTNQNDTRGEGATHAWIEAYVPFSGWVGLDPTNNCLAGDQYVRLAFGRSFSDCSPVKGVYKGTSGHVLEVGVSVSYENGKINEEGATVLTTQPSSSKNGAEQNSYRRYMEMMQQQQ